MRNKAYSIFTLFCLAAPLLAGYGCLQYEKMLVRKAVKQQLLAGMESSDLVLLKFTQTEAQSSLRWEKAHEFEYRGQMYDIVRSETRGDTIYYHCYWDHAESKLNQQIKKLVAQGLEKDPVNQENQLKLIQLYKSLFPCEAADWQCVAANVEPMPPYPVAATPTLRGLQPPPLPPPELG